MLSFLILNSSKDLRRMVIASRVTTTYREVENHELILSRIVSALRRPLRECLEKYRTLIRSCPRGAIGKEVPVKGLCLTGSDREPAIKLVTYRHLGPPLCARLLLDGCGDPTCSLSVLRAVGSGKGVFFGVPGLVKSQCDGAWRWWPLRRRLAWPVRPVASPAGNLAGSTALAQRR